MSWYRVEVGRHTHRKIKRLARTLGVTRMHAVGLHDVLLSMVTEAGRARGDLEGITAEDLAAECDFAGDPKVLIEAFISSNLIDDRKGRLYVHDYEDRSGKEAKRLKEYRRTRTVRVQEANGTRTVTYGRTDGRTDERTDERTDGSEDECAAPADGVAAPKPPASNGALARAEEVELNFPVANNGGKPWPLTKAKVEEYKASFPGVDVHQQMRVARQWCIDHPDRQKTPRGMPAFLSSWLSREQNRAHSGPTTPTPPARPANLTAGERQIASARRLVEEAQEAEKFGRGK